MLVELEPLCRRIGDHEGLTFALYLQAALLSGNQAQLVAALALAQEALLLAKQFHLTDLERLSEALVQETKARQPNSEP